MYKLLLAPAIILLLALLLHQNRDMARISVFEAAMPAILTASLIAEQFGLNTKLTNLVVGTGIIAGLFTTAGWYAIIQWLL